MLAQVYQGILNKITYMVLHVEVPPMQQTPKGCPLTLGRIWKLGEMQTTQTHQISYSESWTICILTFWRVILMLGQPENRW